MGSGFKLGEGLFQGLVLGSVTPDGSLPRFGGCLVSLLDAFGDAVELAAGGIEPAVGDTWGVRGVLPRRPVKTGAVLYLRATAALILPLVVDVVVPAVLVRSSGAHVERGGYYLFGAPLIVFGCFLLFDSVFLRFAREGRGTLAPIDPPRFVVGGGAYRIIRNPMYVANVAIVVGSAAMFRSLQLLAWAVGILLAFHVFVVAYEEPTLRRLFGEDYDSYRRDVGRWIPRRRDHSPPRHEERS